MIKLILCSRFRGVFRQFRREVSRTNLCSHPVLHCRYHADTFSQEDELVEFLISSVVDDVYSSRNCELSSSRNTKSTSSPSVIGSRVASFPSSEAGHSLSRKPSLQARSSKECNDASRAKSISWEYITESNSFVCVRRQPSSSVNSPFEVEWKCCRCQNFNRVGAKKCIHCKSDATESYRTKFPPSRLITLFPPTWICDECGNRNTSSQHPSLPESSSILSERLSQRSKFFCAKCQSPFKGVRKWACSSCDCINSRASNQCSSCFRERPPGWVCKQCSEASNSIFTLQCRVCKSFRPSRCSEGIQKCTLCGEVNDVRSELCEYCVAPLQALQSFFSSPAQLEGSKMPATGAALQKEVKTPSNTFCEEMSLLQSTDTVIDEPMVQDGSWWCPKCNIILRRNATFCDICLTPRGETPTSSNSKRAGTPLSRQTQAGDWQCPYCRQLNEMRVKSCCGKERECPVGYWLCFHCSSVNRNERHLCLGCGREPSETTWNCKVCRTSNNVHVFSCVTCASPHPLLWACSACGKTYHYSFLKCHCGMPRPDPPVPVVCPLCGAPNAEKRKSCFRCRGRLFSHQWKCSECRYEKNARALYRCERCFSPRPFSMEEITWVCDVCSTAVDSGGDLPERFQCPKCNSPYTTHCLKFPARWICKGCRLQANRSTSPTCMECGQRRSLTPFKCPAVCPHCFQDTVLTEKEMCSLCEGSLSALLSAPGEVVQGMETPVFNQLFSE